MLLQPCGFSLLISTILDQVIAFACIASPATTFTSTFITKFIFLFQCLIQRIDHSTSFTTLFSTLFAFTSISFNFLNAGLFPHRYRNVVVCHFIHTVLIWLTASWSESAAHKLPLSHERLHSLILLLTSYNKNVSKPAVRLVLLLDEVDFI